MTKQMMNTDPGSRGQRVLSSTGTIYMYPTACGIQGPQATGQCINSWTATALYTKGIQELYFKICDSQHALLNLYIGQSY